MHLTRSSLYQVRAVAFIHAPTSYHNHILRNYLKLQDSVPATSFDKVRPIIEKEIGKIEEKFDDLDQHSLSWGIIRSGAPRNKKWSTSHSKNKATRN